LSQFKSNPRYTRQVKKINKMLAAYNLTYDCSVNANLLIVLFLPLAIKMISIVLNLF